MGLLKTAGKVAIATRVHGNVQRRQQQRWAEEDRAAAAASPPTAASHSSTAEMIDHLTQLGALRDSGVLTDDEFEAQKAHILMKARQA